MSRIRYTVLALALILSAGSVSAAVVAPVFFPQAEAVSAEESVDVPYYELRAEGGEVCVYEGEKLILRTGVAVSSLPASDRALLDGGIVASSPEELTRLLEDLTS